MNDARIGRVLVASLHEAIEEVLPSRVEFYEHWLSASGLREGSIRPAAMAGVLGFLRREGRDYATVTARAGDLAAEWTFHEEAGFRQSFVSRLPVWIRMRDALSVWRQLVRATSGTSRTVSRVHGRVADLDIQGSVFCEVRQMSPSPLCHFYGTAMERVLRLYDLDADVEIQGCRAVDGGLCRLVVLVNGNGRRARRAGG